jgi:hypothetical protein
VNSTVRNLALVVVAVAATASACGSAGSTTPESTVTQTVTVPPSAGAVPPADDNPAEDAPAENPTAEAPAAKISVPAVVGMNHQAAQDTMQAAGLYNLREHDGSGQNRLLIWDRNWTTIAQDPPAGTLVSPDAVITLTAVKKSD